MALIQSIFGIPLERQLIYRKSSLKNIFALDEISILQYINKSLMSLKVHEGTVLLLEEKTHDDSKWKQEMDKESYKIALKFNNLNTLKYEHEIILDKREILKNLKSFISSVVGIHEDQFLMKRGSQHGHELKDMEVSLVTAHLNNGSIVHIEPGKPSKPEEIQIVLSLAVLASVGDPDSECYRFYGLSDLKAPKDSTMAELRTIICGHITNMFPSLEVSPQLIRIRERNMNHLLKVMTDHDLLSDFHGIDKIHLAIQVLNEPETIQNTQLIIITRKWSPSTWELSAPMEIVINKKARIEELGKQLANCYDIATNLIQICVIPYVYAFVRGELVQERWIQTFGNYGPIFSSPFFVNKDGTLMIVRDSLETVREMTQDEKYKFTFKNYGIKSTRSIPAPYKEKAVKITVKKSKNHNSTEK